MRGCGLRATGSCGYCVAGRHGDRMRLDRDMDATAGSLITAFDYVWARLTGRLAGLTDEE